MADESRINEAAPGVVETTDRGLFDFMKKKEDVAKPSDHDTMVSGVEKVHISEPEYRKEEEKKEEKHESVLEKLKHSESSSSSDEEDDEEKKRRKRERKEKKKGALKEKFEEKFGHKEGQHHDQHHHGDTNVPIEKVHVQENVYSEPSYVAHPPQHHEHHVEPTYVEHPQHFESSHVAPPQHIVTDHVHQEADVKKQGGFMDKIKDKLPGHKNEAETKDKAETKTEAAAVAAPVLAHHDESHVEGEKDKKGFLDKIKEKIPGFHSKTDAEEKDHHDEEKKEGGHY